MEIKNLSDLEKAICKNVNVLTTDKGYPCATIIDEELDPIECIFGDGYVELDTSSYKHLTLSVENLKTLQKLIKKAQAYFESFYEEDDVNEE
jgi:hypothetical protein